MHPDSLYFVFAVETVNGTFVFKSVQAGAAATIPSVIKAAVFIVEPVALTDRKNGFTLRYVSFSSWVKSGDLS